MANKNSIFSLRGKGSVDGVLQQREFDSIRDLIRQVPEKHLPREEQITLVSKAQKGDGAALDLLVRTNLLLVVAVAKRFIGRGVDLQDLVQEGIVGFMRAVKDYDPKKDTALSTYASHWIRQNMSRHIEKHGATVRITSGVLPNLMRFRGLVTEIDANLGRRSTPQEIAEYTKQPIEVVLRNLAAISQKSVSLYTQRGGDKKPSTLADAYLDTKTLSLSSQEELKAELVEHERAIRHMLGLLEILPISERDLEIFKLHYPVRYSSGRRRMSARAVGQQTGGVTGERVRQVCGRVWCMLDLLGGISDPKLFSVTLLQMENLRLRLGVNAPPTILPFVFAEEEKVALQTELRNHGYF